MSLSWKLLPFAAFAVLGALFLSGLSPDSARADVDSVEVEGNVVTVEADLDDGDLVITLSSIESDTETEMELTDCNGCDEEGDTHETTLTIDTNDSGFTDGTVEVTLTLTCPDPDSITVTATQGGVSADATVECTPGTVTPTVSATVGAAATVVAQASPSTVNCNGTSIVTIQVKTAGGQPVAVGTAVTIQASIGSVSPSSGQTTSADGSVFVFYTAPSNAGGAATITARAGNAQGTATVTVNCAAAAPTATTAPSAPPPTVNPGSISPPNTGDAGIASERTDWTPFAGMAVIVATLIGGAVAAVKTRD
jgi:hypothetical protein